MSDPSFDQAMMAELERIFRAEAAERLQALQGLWAQLGQKQGDPDALLAVARREAHTLKGSAATVNNERAHQLSVRLEKQIVGLMGGGTFPSPVALAALQIISNEIAKSVAEQPA